jgi:hypothetical protein
MKTMLMAVAVATAGYVGVVSAGEDSTDRFGAGGTGVLVSTTDCGLIRFQGPAGNRTERRPCGRHGMAYDENGKPVASAAGQGADSKLRTPGDSVGKAAKEEESLKQSALGQRRARLCEAFVRRLKLHNVYYVKSSIPVSRSAAKRRGFTGWRVSWRSSPILRA